MTFEQMTRPDRRSKRLSAGLRPMVIEAPETILTRNRGFFSQAMAVRQQADFRKCVRHAAKISGSYNSGTAVHSLNIIITRSAIFEASRHIKVRPSLPSLYPRRHGSLYDQSFNPLRLFPSRPLSLAQILQHP